MKFCGPKLSLCGLIISVWGIIQLVSAPRFLLRPSLTSPQVQFCCFFQVLMGIFYYFKSVALAEDLPGMEESFSGIDEFYTQADRGYTQVYWWFQFTLKFSKINSNPSFVETFRWIIYCLWFGEK